MVVCEAFSLVPILVGGHACCLVCICVVCVVVCVDFCLDHILAVGHVLRVAETEAQFAVVSKCPLAQIFLRRAEIPYSPSVVLV